MINIQVNNALERAKSDCAATAISLGEEFCVTVGYDDYDRLAWVVVSASEIRVNDEVVFRARPDGSTESAT